MWGTTAIGYNVDKIKERMPDAPVDSWAMIFDPKVVAKFADCGVHVLDSPDDMIPAALNYLGLDPNSARIRPRSQQAGDLLKSIRPHIQKFHSSEYINALANGDICLAVGYSGDVLQARDRAAEAGNDVNDRLFDPEGRRADLARQLCASRPTRRIPTRRTPSSTSCCRPDIAARNSNFVFYANGNLASQRVLDEEVHERHGASIPTRRRSPSSTRRRRAIRACSARSRASGRK